MTTFVRISDAGAILETVDFDPTGKFHPDLIWTPFTTVQERQAAMLSMLAAIRWQREEGGTALPDGTPTATDRSTQSKLTAGYLKASQNPDYTINDWKLATGVFVTLDAPTIIAIGDAVEAHIQACFSHESVLSAALLAAETVEALEAIDLNAGWP